MPGSKDRCASRRGNLCAVRGHTSGIFVNRPSWAKVNPNQSLGHRLGVKARNCISNVCTSPSHTSTIKARNSKHKAGQAEIEKGTKSKVFWSKVRIFVSLNLQLAFRVQSYFVLSSCRPAANLVEGVTTYDETKRQTRCRQQSGNIWKAGKRNKTYIWWCKDQLGLNNTMFNHASICRLVCRHRRNPYPIR